MNPFQQRTATWQAQIEENRWSRWLISLGFAGFLAIMAAISFPVPWTPVPFSMTPFALLVLGAYQRPMFAALSVVLYLLAGAVGAPIFAGGSSGWQHLIGSTGGYLIGYIFIAAFVAWYMKERRSMMSKKWAQSVLAGVGVLALTGLTAIAWFMTTGNGFSDARGPPGWNPVDWGITPSILWVLVFVTGVAGAITIWSLRASRQDPTPALNLMLVMLAGIGILHACGVLVLWMMTPATLVGAMILGSAMFIPFDLIKAALAVGLSLPFLPPAGEASSAMADLPEATA